MIDSGMTGRFSFWFQSMATTHQLYSLGTKKRKISRGTLSFPGFVIFHQYNYFDKLDHTKSSGK